MVSKKKLKLMLFLISAMSLVLTLTIKAILKTKRGGNKDENNQ